MTRYSVSSLTLAISDLIGEGFGEVLVEGEVSSFKEAPSKHWFITLKDEKATLACKMWASQNARLRRQPRVGERIVVAGRLEVYAPQGAYSLTIRDMRAAGAGDLAARLAALKAKLQAEGLFAQERKRPLPRFPAVIGVATSPTGAALRDILHVLGKRFPAIPVLISPCRVQGDGAPAEIAAAIDRLSEDGRATVIIVGRGGGSSEDLSAFNDELVVRAVVRSRVPVVSAVGHEVDTSLCDLAADLRAATPSHAAELVSPDQAELRLRLEQHRERLTGAARRQLKRKRLELGRLRLLHPRQRVERGRMRAAELEERLWSAMERTQRLRRERLSRSARALHNLSPLAVLGRGYALVWRDGRVLTESSQSKVGDHVRIRLQKGELQATVTAVEPEG